jgi:hypothetical protein
MKSLGQIEMTVCGYILELQSGWHKTLVSRNPKDFSLKAGLDQRQRQQSMDSVEKRKRREEHQRQITERMLANNADAASMEDRRASE